MKAAYSGCMWNILATITVTLTTKHVNVLLYDSMTSIRNNFVSHYTLKNTLLVVF